MCPGENKQAGSYQKEAKEDLELEAGRGQGGGKGAGQPGFHLGTVEITKQSKADLHGGSICFLENDVSGQGRWRRVPRVQGADGRGGRAAPVQHGEPDTRGGRSAWVLDTHWARARA